MNQASETYFNDLQLDLERLGLSSYGGTITDICHLADELECTTSISTRTAKKRFEAATEIGELIMAWAPVSFNPNVNGMGMCPAAEPRFIANVESANDECLRSPVVILDKDEPVAVAKAYGEPTIYSFTNKKSKGLLKDTICYNQQLENEVDRLPYVVGVYLLELSEISMDFEPLRVSTLATRGGPRSRLSDINSYYEDVGRSHLDIDQSQGSMAMWLACYELMQSSDITVLKFDYNAELKPARPISPQAVLI